MEQAGNVPTLAALNQRALYEESRVSLARAELRENTARQRLSVAMGLHGAESAAWKALASLPEPPEKELDVSDVERRAVKASLDLELLRTTKDAFGRAADSAAARGIVPEISAGVRAEREGEQWGVGPQVGLEIPIFYQGQGEVGAAEAKMKEADAKLEATAVRVRASAHALAARLAGARSAALFYRDTLVPLRKKIVAETLLQYNAMSIGAFELVAAKRSELEAERASAEALADYWAARAELDLLLKGKLPSGALTEPMPTPAPSSAGSGGGGH
jgi:outer membrane protein TolC